MCRGALLLALLACVRAEVLTPPYFNLALGKKVTASATCGDEGPELYCKLVGANADHDEHVIQGQVCDYCDPSSESKRHPPEYAVDGMETWWQSPPLSRGMKYNEVNLTIDLGQEFHVAYVFVRMGNSPRPGLWALEKSTDYGKTFKPWQYFSDSTADCERYFGKESVDAKITRDDSVICSTEYSKIVPLEGGEIPISLLTYRPSAYNYFNSSVLQEWTRATNVRLRLLRTKNLLGHLMSVARQDPTVTRRYFYSIKDISIGGRCMCNGHADTCDPSAPESESTLLVCRCQHNTCGAQCAQCCPGFEQKKWRISQTWDRFSCEPCNCHNHTTECTYDPLVDERRQSLDIHGRWEGGGVCQNCQHNTEGVNCNKCRPTYYRPYGKRWDEVDVCRPCNCDRHYSTGNCAEETGQCECRREYNPPLCNSCAYGYFDYPDCKPCTCNLNGTRGAHCTPTDGFCPCKDNYDGQSCEICRDGFYSPECKACECNSIGSVSSVCDKSSGNCTCKSKYAGRACDMCEAGYYEYPNCKHCNCDVSGTLPNVCDDLTGQCICKEGFGGARCEQCIAGFYMEVRGRERQCVPCKCSITGSSTTSCLPDGKCICLGNFGGRQCDQCSPGHYKYPECLPCNCDPSGSVGSTCDDNGMCHCKPNFDGQTCDHCKEQFYNYPACEECNCDPRGVVASFAGCGSVPAGELCQCKPRVEGRICNDCKPLFWNLQEYNPYGCEECNCRLAGTLGGLGACDTRTGQCTCKLHVGRPRCDTCQDGFYRLQSDDVFGCTECDCDVGGSIDNNCDKATGQCRCHSRVEGRRCDRPIQAYYFPTLHQFQYEVEEGMTPSGAVRYRNSEEAFPGYSWKGYVVFTVLQNQVMTVVHISTKSSLYRMVIRYANRLPDAVTATVSITPDNTVDSPQTFSVYLPPTTEPRLTTVAGERGAAPAPLVMNPGTWTVTIKTTREIMIDYFVLIPGPYYEATVLTKLVDRPCAVGDATLCKQFAYPSLAAYPSADYNDLDTIATVFIDDEQQLEELSAGPTEIPVLSRAQGELSYKLNVDYDPAKNTSYVLLIEYVTPIDRSPPVDTNATSSYIPINPIVVRLRSGSGAESVAIVNLNSCPYTAPCRQVAIDDAARIYLFNNVKDASNVVYLEGESITSAGIKSIVLIPYEEWHLDYITPRPYCLRRNGRCEPAVFSAAPDSKKLEIESGVGGDRETRPSILDNSTVVVYLSRDAGSVSLNGRVSRPGDYMFLVHYYQPDHPESSIEARVSAGGVIQNGRVRVEHCPSNSGCRVLVRLADNADTIPVVDNFTLTFRDNSTRGVWIDYVLVVAAPDFVETALREANTLDYTREFIDRCAADHYYIATTETGFCRDAVFSITAEYNGGTLRCFCDVEGSTDLECEQFGGQCRCRDNVVGRTCSSCRTGYYGFPNCRPCHCPSTAVCDNEGRCNCPHNVEGKNCDQCKPLTFNFDELRGCDDCNCNPLGVVQGRLQCDRDSGACDCKTNVIGRVCDRCVPGHYAFPYCYQCSCARAGSSDDVCDQRTAQCYCKKHVRGQACDTCKEEYYNLQADNPEGCTKCHCFGKTTRCTSSYLYFAEINGMSGWSLANIELDRSLTAYPLSVGPSELNNTVVSADATQKLLYFSAPHYYLGKRLTSYGGYLSYTVYYLTGLDGHAVSAPDVILGGPNGYIVHSSVEVPTAHSEWSHAVKLSEDDFVNLDGSAVTKDQFMNLIVNVDSIYIRATYEAEGVTTRLMDVSLEVGVEDYAPDARLASSVEQCQCPSAYKGSSCEQCVEGHYRLSAGPHAGFCVPCQCNGHTNTCDVNTGVCLECDHNTMGDHCEQCVPGYHGDATHGTPRDCLICACPMPYSSNNFAIGCDLSENGSLISCDCKPGYGGARCEYCAAGYYGVPENVGDHCKPCNCSGNIVVSDPGSCDSITGDCLKCVNNTAGAACNLCAPGFFGDAIFSKNCTACICDELGMDHCDSSTGTCVCRSGVVGEKCDACAPLHYGLSSGRGCSACDCAAASLSKQCDDPSGQCRCAKGVTGRRCEQCAAGYWNYTEEGCVHCNCNTGYSVGFMCNATGQCKCLPGVVGEKCDRCPERWVLIPHQGCQECDSCTDALLLTVEDMSRDLTTETQDFKDKADSFFTTQRLNYMREQVSKLGPRVRELRSVDDAGAAAAVEGVETTARNMLRSAEFAAANSDKQIGRAAELAASASAVLSSARERAARAQAAVSHVADLATGLELSQQPKVDSALQEAEQIKSDIAAKDLTPRERQAADALSNATIQIERMNAFVRPFNQQGKKFEELVNSTRGLKSKLDEMVGYVDLAQRKADEAARLHARNRASKIGSKEDSVTDLNAGAIGDLIAAGYDLNNASAYIGFITNNQTRYTQALLSNSGANNDMRTRLADFAKEIPELNSLAAEADLHASALRTRAASLRDLADRESNNSRTQHAYSAASAYSSIVKEIGDAKRSADVAEAAVNNVTAINKNLSERVTPSRDRSSELLNRAASLLASVTGPLETTLAAADTQQASTADTIRYANGNHSAILLSLPTLPAHTLPASTDKAEGVASKVKDTKETMRQLGADVATAKDWATSLPQQANDAQNKLANLDSLMKDLNEQLPTVAPKLQALKDRQQGIDDQHKASDERLKELRNLIERARATVSRIPVGVSFDTRTTLQPRLPDAVDEMSTSTHVSAYFRTREPEGLLLYLGNPKDDTSGPRRGKSDDFMVVSLHNGLPYLTMDIGDSAVSGRDPVKIPSDKYVADYKWYQLVVDRVGRNVKFSIRESLDNGSELTHTKEAVLPGDNSIFNLERDRARLYVGGAPADSHLQGVQYPAFRGEVEELTIGHTPIGLWNFEHASHLQGARQRDKLIVPQSGPTECRFNGRAHVVMPGGRYLDTQYNQIQLHFRTYASDGLLHLVGSGDRFFNIQMQDGKVYLQVSLGNTDDMVIIGTSKAYNDGKWHRIDAKRDATQCLLQVDDETLLQNFSTANDNPVITAVDSMNFGGNNNKITLVKDVGFDGCLRQISIGGVNLDLTDHTESIGVTYGCQFASLVSLSGDQSFLRFNDITAENLQLTVKFRTAQPDGLVFVYVDRTQTTGASSIALALVNGQLVLNSQREKLESTGATYNDSQWHVVSVTHNNDLLRMAVDDVDSYRTDTAPEPLHILEGTLFVGGVQPGYVVSGKLPTRAHFAGCVADAAVNGRVLNLLDPYRNRSVTFGRCGEVTSSGGPEPGAPWSVPTMEVLPTPQINTDVDQPTEKADAGESGTAAPPPSTRAPSGPPQPEQGCALAYDPQYDLGSPEEGYRFGTRNDSHIRFASLPGRQTGQFDLAVSFRTFDHHGGLVLYAAAEAYPGQFLAVYMQDAQVHFLFNCGGQTGRVVSPSTYNDTRWHTATIVRHGGHGKLSIDSERVGEDSVTCNAQSVLTAPYYYGGLNLKRATETIRQNLLSFYQPFKGCLRGLKMNDQLVTDVQERVNSLRCTDNVEDGVYFGPSANSHSNYLKLQENFKVGFEISISMEIKPRNSTGLLLAVHGRRDFMVIELLEKEVVVNVDNGKGAFHASYKLGDRFTLCDGSWHRIYAVKSRHVVSVGVDGHFSDAGLGSPTSGSTDTKSALYIGGHEKPISKLRGVRSLRGFTGCIRNLVIHEAPVQVRASAAGRNTHVGVCPKD